MENKDFSSSKLVIDLLAACSANGQQAPKNVAVGNNGYTIGEQFHTTGMELVTTEINGNKMSYVGITTKEGVTISVKSVLGLSSLNGYEMEGEFVAESDNEAGEKIESKVVAKVVKGFEFKNVYHSNLGLLDYIADCESNKFWEGKILTFLGNVVRSIIARKDSPVTSFEHYKAGYKRCISAKLWNVR